MRGGINRRTAGAARCERLESRTALAADLVPAPAHHWNFDEGPDWHDSAPGTPGPATVADATGAAAARSASGAALPFVSGTRLTGIDMAAAGRPLLLAADLRPDFVGPCTVSFWCLTTSRGSAAAATAPAVFGSSRFAVGALDAQGRIGVIAGGRWGLVSSLPINDGRWHFVSVVLGGPRGLAEIAVDGVAAAADRLAPWSNPLPITALGGRSGSTAVFPGRVDEVSIHRGRLAPATLAVIRDNHAPKTWGIAADGTVGQEIRTASVLLSAYDVEGDPLRVVRFTQPANGRARHLGDGSFAIQPTAGFTGHNRMTAVVTDGRGGFASIAIEIDVLPAPARGGRASAFVDFAPVVAAGTPLRTASAWRVPRAVDLDRDGRVDLLVAADGGVTFYRNVGPKGRPVFAAGVPVRAAGGPIGLPGNASLAVADMNGDGRLDMVLPRADGVLEVYANMSAGAGTPLFAAPTPLADAHGNPFVMPDSRFDVGDFDGDGRPDLVVGTFAGDVRLFANVGSPTRPRLDRGGVVLTSGAYNLFPRIVDASRNGMPDLLLGVNWGTVRAWLDPGLSGGRLNPSRSAELSITDAWGAVPDLHGLTDGPVVDVADIDGDGTVDMVIGGQLAGDVIYIARGRAAGVTTDLDELAAVFKSNPTNLGAALDADGGRLLARVRGALGRIVNIVQTAPAGERAAIWAAFAAHVRQVPGLQLRRPVDVATEHHLPGIIAQYAVIAGNILPDTPRQRGVVADLFGMDGERRRIYLESRVVVGDNVSASAGQLATLREFLRHQPRASFPDDIITVDNFFGDGRGGLVAVFNGSKNTFGVPTGTASDEWPGDVRAALAAAKPGNPTAGDLFTFVVGHEVTHSLDAYVRSRGNTELARRWGRMLCLAAGDDVVAGADGWIDWAATRDRFRDRGHWNGVADEWGSAWQAYWSTGPGAARNDSSFLRGGISWFLENPQESLATQGNQHWVDSEGRLLGAVDRLRHGIAPPLTEAVTFLDFVSVGLNRVAMFDIDPDPVRGRAVWKVAFADLRRDDRGLITEVRMSDSGRTYRFTVDAAGVYRGVTMGTPQAR